MALVALLVAGVTFGAAVLRWPHVGSVAASARPGAAGAGVISHPVAAAASGGSSADAPSGHLAVSRVGMVAPRPAPQLPPRYPARAPVLLVGDSLAVGIADLLTTGWPKRAVSVEAEVGRATSTSAALLADHAETTGPVWVVSLGTNDLPSDFPAAARALMRLAGPSRCVLWYDVHRASTQDQINADLARLARRHENLHILGWQALAQAHPEWFGPDGIHPAEAGYLARASLATRAVASQCTVGGSATTPG